MIGIDSGGAPESATLILQFRVGATEPTPREMERLTKALVMAFPGRHVVLLPCGIEVAPGTKQDIRELGEKLDALIGAIADEGEEGQDASATSLDGERMPAERDQSQSLG